MTQSRADKIAPYIWTRLEQLSPNDLSINKAAVRQAGTAMVTGEGSANDVLWSDMAELGWTREIGLDKPLPAAGARAFAFTDAGVEVITGALVERARQKATLLGKIKGYRPDLAPARVTAVCERLGDMSVKLLAILIVARGQAPKTQESQARHADYMAALETVVRGVERAAGAIGDAIAAGPDSDDGRDRLERTVKALDYADQWLGARRY